MIEVTQVSHILTLPLSSTSFLKHKSSFFTLILIFLLVSAPDNTTLVYKRCANQPLPDPNGVYSSSFSAIFGTLIQQSSKAKWESSKWESSNIWNGVESIVGSGNGGFYTTSYESVYVLGQCQGDLGASNCGNCVKSVVQRAQVECGSSALVKELEEMGFKQLDLNTEVLRMNDYDLEKSIDDLCGVLEWDPIQTVGNGERGFGDTVRVN
ncbi:putative Gnk2-like domain-containing protein [Helianthus annuus]|nr:putative Gnk2-like domain-containing protein [Helianthus annuus]